MHLPDATRPQTFLYRADERVIIEVIKRAYSYIENYIDRSLPKEHVGYIVDRTGYQTFRDRVLKDVELNPKAQVADHIQWNGYKY